MADTPEIKFIKQKEKNNDIQIKAKFSRSFNRRVRLSLIDCASSGSKPSEETTVKPAATVETKTAEKTTTGDATNFTAPSSDKVGVAECDDYIEKYEACVRVNVPESARQTLKDSFDKTRQTWKNLAANPQTKATLASVCKQSKEMAQQNMGAYHCNW